MNGTDSPKNDKTQGRADYVRIEAICSIPSIANEYHHWSKRHVLFKTQRMLILCEWRKQKTKPSLPCIVTLTRIAPRSLDEDNLAYAFKGIRDFIADELIPGLAKGRADGDSRIQWRYKQEKGKIQKVRVEIDPCEPFTA